MISSVIRESDGMNYRILQGDALAMLRTLPDESVHCGVTSPPYFGLRDYGTAEWDGGDPDCDHKPGNDSRVGRTGLQGGTKTAGHKAEGYGLTCGKCGAVRVDNQIGLEPTPEEYVARLVDVFREFRRVLRSDGVLWVNIGDSYNGSGGAGGDYGAGGIRDGQPKFPGRSIAQLKPKDLIGIPWRLAFALQTDGWYLRSDVIWHKPNPMPESVTDRPTKAHEYLFLLTKSARYFYDAQAIAEQAQQWPGQAGTFARNGAVSDHVLPGQTAAQHRSERTDRVDGATRNRRSVWTVATESTPYAHFATMPTALVEPCILAGTSARGVCPVCGAPWARVVDKEFAPQTDVRDPAKLAKGSNKGMDASNGWGDTPRGTTVVTTAGWQPTCTCADARAEAEQLLADVGVRADFPDLTPIPATVLDPFAGSGTTLRVAVNLGRRAIGIELNPEYVALAERLLGQTQPALLGV